MEKNQKETCPVCGHRSRWPNHPQCHKCNGEYQRKALIKMKGEEEKTKEGDRWLYEEITGDIVTDCLSKARETLLRKKTELAQVEAITAPYWEEAKEMVQANMAAKGMCYSSKYGRAVRDKFFEIIQNTDLEQASKKAYGLSKSVSSLKALIGSFEKRLQERVKEAAQVVA